MGCGLHKPSATKWPSRRLVKKLAHRPEQIKTAIDVALVRDYHFASGHLYVKREYLKKSFLKHHLSFNMAEGYVDTYN